MSDMDVNEQQASTGAAAEMDAANGAMAQEERELKQKELQEELTKTEEEVNTLRQVLASKQKRVQDLKKLLGVGIVSKISKDMNEGLTRLNETEVMMKANSALKSAGEKTSAAFSTVGKKLEDVKDKAKVKAGGAYQSVKAKVGGVKSDTATAAAPEALAEEVKPAEN